MRRWTFRILICLLLGVVTTVGVAWGLALWTDTNPPVFAYHGPAATVEPRWSFLEKKTPYAHVIHLWATNVAIGSPPPDVTPKWSQAPFPPTAGDVSRGTTLSERASGWPMLAFFGRTRWDNRIGEVIECGVRPGFFVHQGLRPVPVGPIWMGLVVNSTLYGSIWFGVLFGITANRRTIRRRRGRCPKCGYDLRGEFDNGCSECGWGRDVWASSTERRVALASSSFRRSSLP